MEVKKVIAASTFQESKFGLDDRVHLNYSHAICFLYGKAVLLCEDLFFE
jgi:hypothetical protein